MVTSRTGPDPGAYLTSFDAVEQLWVGIPLQSHGAHDALQGEDRNSVSVFQPAVPQSHQQVDCGNVYHSSAATDPPWFDPR